MENFRLYQAQQLIMKISKKNQSNIEFKKPQEGKINVKEFENLFKNIIHSEEFIYSSLPSHDLSQEDAQLFIKYIMAARENIDSILVDFKVLDKKENELDIKKMSSDFLFITTKNNFKKSLKKLGIDISRILVATVPLNIEDMKKINPKIPESALKGIEKKIEHINNDIIRKMTSLNPEKIVVIAEDDINGQILGKRVEEKYDSYIHLNDNIKELSDTELKNILKIAIE